MKEKRGRDPEQDGLFRDMGSIVDVICCYCDWPRGLRVSVHDGGFVDVAEESGASPLSVLVISGNTCGT